MRYVLSLVLCLSACSVTLAPNYDKAIVDGLSAANVKVMEMFAATSSGTDESTFGTREAAYNELIGGLDALVIQISARPMPDGKVLEKVNEALAARKLDALNDGRAPSAYPVEKISATLVKMRDTDKKQGVTSFEVAAFKGQVSIYLDQAITYENFLER